MVGDWIGDEVTFAARLFLRSRKAMAPSGTVRWTIQGPYGVQNIMTGGA
jgi:hypothetical protein